MEGKDLSACNPLCWFVEELPRGVVATTRKGKVRRGRAWEREEIRKGRVGF